MQTRERHSPTTAAALPVVNSVSLSRATSHALPPPPPPHARPTGVAPAAAPHTSSPTAASTDAVFDEPALSQTQANATAASRSISDQHSSTSSKSAVEHNTSSARKQQQPLDQHVKSLSGEQQSKRPSLERQTSFAQTRDRDRERERDGNGDGERDAESITRRGSLKQKQPRLSLASGGSSQQSCSLGPAADGEHAAHWAKSFDALLTDPAGLATFNVRVLWRSHDVVLMYCVLVAREALVSREAQTPRRPLAKSANCQLPIRVQYAGAALARMQMALAWGLTTGAKGTVSASAVGCGVAH